MIVDPILMLAFIPVGLALNVTPGPDMMFCLAQGLRGGARCGWAASSGVALGGMVHVLLAGLGLGALVAALPGAFDVIRWAGAAYLAWIAWKTLRTPIAGSDAPPLAPPAPSRPARDSAPGQGLPGDPSELGAGASSSAWALWFSVTIRVSRRANCRSFRIS